MPTARVDIILYIADRNDSRQISLLMNTCCEFFSWPKLLMRDSGVSSGVMHQGGSVGVTGSAASERTLLNLETQKRNTFVSDFVVSSVQ